MNGQRKVSVIVPVYQAEKYILRCVMSVIHQTYENLEIILIDDGSEDSSLALCFGLAQQDRRIRLYHQENQGVARTRNRGIECAEGEYLLFLDSDDWIDEETLSDMVCAMEKSGTEACICGFWYETEKSRKECRTGGEKAINKNEFRKNSFWRLYENSILFNIGTKLYRKEIIEANYIRFHETMSVYEDICFFLEYLSCTDALFICGKGYYHYFQGNNASITHGYKSSFWKDTAEYCRILSEWDGRGSAELNRAILICLYRAFLQECHNPEKNREAFLQTLREYCFPAAEHLEHEKLRASGLSADEKLFEILLRKKAVSIMWLLAGIVALKDGK